mgnify:CR=1 FL=1
MSVEQAKAFAKKALKDPAILEKLTVDGADPIAIAKEHGHEFDEEHIDSGQSHFDSLIDEMSDEELNDVAGGCLIEQTGDGISNVYRNGKKAVKDMFSSF